MRGRPDYLDAERDFAKRLGDFVVAQAARPAALAADPASIRADDL